MSALILALILIVGYHYQSQHPIRRMELARSSGYHVYFKAGISGLVILGFSVAVWFIIDLLNIPSFLIECVSSGEKLTYLKSQENWNYFKGVAVAALMIATSVCYCFIRRRSYKNDTGKRFRKILNIASDFERLIIEATEATHYVRLEMDCGKVYVGVPESPDLEGGAVTYVSILPFFSGYRNDENKLIFTTSYENHYDRLRSFSSNNDIAAMNHIRTFHIVLPVAKIKIASQFDLNAFLQIEQDYS